MLQLSENRCLPSVSLATPSYANRIVPSAFTLVQLAFLLTAKRPPNLQKRTHPASLWGKCDHKLPHLLTQSVPFRGTKFPSQTPRACLLDSKKRRGSVDPFTGLKWVEATFVGPQSNRPRPQALSDSWCALGNLGIVLFLLGAKGWDGSSGKPWKTNLFHVSPFVNLPRREGATR